ncbi:DUF4145 domain-containing protein [Shewanella baltica]|uniref:DUF4145 domain-containing protein n=1 Tax=Shewanella baltica TaxID=62322 RepID=UPI00217D390F|nr:DUF4145 domain-containing protein [Shewanella baltica]MCS6128340.1 DUF4145 domain-containing protein [Shewanella baltica]MCS6140225.1 DUF4145 domain-containing protein [Shewanella baltica]MCS6146554.1 DUF4145 domain-containing protein [Shewanella baltica]MCS6171084.1 DUF4145 domain-containing protein [Shewanella baltica]MCS6188262.1 DUF4145 domain-containing protein [Shewanella baltica]
MGTKTVIKDSEFIQDFSASLSDDYLKAKSYVQDVPTQSLLHIRSFTHKLTELLGQDKQIAFSSPNLYDRIEQLNQQRVIDVKTTRALHRLRADGNRGAHPEKYHLTQAQLLALAQKSIKDVLALVEHLYPKVKGQVAPDYRYEASDTLTAKDLCYRAVMEDDAEAQYLVGISFKTKALILKEQEQQQDQEFVTSAEATSNPEPSGVLPLTSHISAADSFARAAYWFALAAPKHMEALHEHGVALIHGYQGVPEVAKGEQLIATAAEAGVVNAMALLGYFYLVGSESFRPDSQLALKYLQRAAEGEQTEAMANLGVLYYQQKNLAQAYHFISKAAQAGYPHAQYHLALMLANGDGCTRDMIASEYWMAEAAEQGQLDAMLTRAQHMLNDDNAFGSDLTQAEDYLRQVIKYGHSVPAMIELSMALADGILGRVDVVGAAALLKLARQNANKKEADIIEPLWRSLALQIENVLKVTQDPAEIHSLNRAQTLLA